MCKLFNLSNLFILIFFSGCVAGEGINIERLAGGNQNISISTISNQSINANEASSAISLVVSEKGNDSLSCASDLSATSTNTTLIDSSDFTFSGTAPNCSLSFTPNSNMYGSSTIKMSYKTKSVSFNLNVSFIPKIITGMNIWLDASDTSTVFKDSACTVAATGDTDDVGCWLDKSGNSFNATMSTASYIPKLNLSDNFGSIEFDGIDDHLEDAHSFTAKTVFIIYKMDSSLQGTGELAQLWGNYTQGHLAPDPRNAGTWSFDGNVGTTAKHSLNGGSDTGAASGGTNSNPWSYDTFEIVKGEFNSAVSFTKQVLGTIAPTFSVGDHQLGGQISEVIVYSGNLSVSDTQSIEGYLACKYDTRSKLDVSHPYYNAVNNEESGCL